MVRSETGPKMLSPTLVWTVLFLMGLHKVGATWPGNVLDTTFTTDVDAWSSGGAINVVTGCGTLSTSQYLYSGYVIVLISYRNSQFTCWNAHTEDQGDGGKWRLLRLDYEYQGNFTMDMQFKVETAVWIGSFQLKCYLYLDQSTATEALQSFLAPETTTTNGPSTTSPVPSPTSPVPSPTSLSTLASTTTGKPTTQTPTTGTTYSSTTATLVTDVSLTQPMATVMTLREVAAIADRPVKDYIAVSSSNMTDHITSSPALWDRFSPNVLTCARQCLRDLKCLALFYTTSQGRCMGHHSHVQYDLTNHVSSTGTQYYMLV